MSATVEVPIGEFGATVRITRPAENRLRKTAKRAERKKRALSMLVRGNTKLGKDVLHFSIPAGINCPGATAFCLGTADDPGSCYALGGKFQVPNVRAGHSARRIASEDSDAFVATVLRELSKADPALPVRIHVAGDFYAASYVSSWRSIIEASPERTFYFYTRSYRDVPAVSGELRALVLALASLPNVTAWASTDPDIPATDVPVGFHEARTFPKGVTARDARLAGYVVCPENVKARPDCSSCGLCWRARSDRPVKLAFLEH